MDRAAESKLLRKPGLLHSQQTPTQDNAIGGMRADALPRQVDDDIATLNGESCHGPVDGINYKSLHNQKSISKPTVCQIRRQIDKKSPHGCPKGC